MSQLHSARIENPTSTEKPHVGVPEPVPEWNEARVKWGWAWPLHHYGYGLAFLVVGVYGMWLVKRLWKSSSRRPRRYFMCIALLITFFGWSRATVLILDPYTFHNPVHFPPSLGLLMFSMGYPCLTAGFFLINWSLIEVTKLQLLPSRIHQRKVLVLVLTVHFLVVISFDVSFSFFPSTHMLLFICRSFFVLWGILLFGGFIFGGLKIQRQVRRNMLRLNNMGQVSSVGSIKTSNGEGAVGRSRPDNSQAVVATPSHVRTGKVMKIAGRAAFAGLLICCTQIYALWEFYVFYNNDIQPKPWPWWGYQTCFRTIELFMVSQMFCVVRQ